LLPRTCLVDLHGLGRVRSKELIRLSSRACSLFFSFSAFFMTYSMRLVQREGRRIARFLQRRDSSAGASTTSSTPSPSISEGPELALPPTTTPVATSNHFPATSQTLAIALSILGFIVLGMSSSMEYHLYFTSIRHCVLAHTGAEKEVHERRRQRC
jgi:hypothetical protein